VIGCEWVVGFLAFATYPAGDSGVSDLFGSLSIVAFVVEAFRFWVLSVPKCLTVRASCDVACKGSTVKARALQAHC